MVDSGVVLLEIGWPWVWQIAEEELERLGFRIIVRLGDDYIGEIMGLMGK